MPPKNSVVVPGLDDHGDDRVKREVDGVRPFREIRRQPDLRWFASGLIVDELDPVDAKVVGGTPSMPDGKSSSKPIFTSSTRLSVIA
jgi:hypothetical protein